MTRIAPCGHCGLQAAVVCRYDRPSPTTGDFHRHEFCGPGCMNEWLRAQDRLQDPGIVTALGHAPGQDT